MTDDSQPLFTPDDISLVLAAANTVTHDAYYMTVFLDLPSTDESERALAARYASLAERLQQWLDQPQYNTQFNRFPVPQPDVTMTTTTFCLDQDNKPVFGFVQDGSNYTPLPVASDLDSGEG